jgi:hypothetical protein
MRDPALLRVAARLAQVLGSEHCLLVGGLAVAGHGYVRATDDVDFVVDVPLTAVREGLAAQGIATTLMRGDPTEGDFPCLRGTLDGVRFDILPKLVPLEWNDATTISTEEGPLRLVGLEGLLRLKFRAQGPQDLLDAAVLVLRHPEYRERAREIAAAYRVQDRFDSYLANRRTQATAEEERARDEGAPRASRAKPRRKRS